MTVLSQALYELNELRRQMANVVRIGVVHDVDLDAARVRVAYAEGAGGEPVLTAWLPWIAERAGADRSWWPPAPGEQVTLLSPSGDLAQAVALGSLYRDSMPAPASAPGKRVTVHADGAIVEYDSETHRLRAELPATATAALIAPGGLRIEGDTTIVGEVAIEGGATVSADLAVTGQSRGGTVVGDTTVSDVNGSMQEMRGFYNVHTHAPPLSPTPTPAMN